MHSLCLSVTILMNLIGLLDTKLELQFTVRTGMNMQVNVRKQYFTCTNYSCYYTAELSAVKLMFSDISRDFVLQISVQDKNFYGPQHYSSLLARYNIIVS